MTGPETSQRLEADPIERENERLQAENARLVGELATVVRLNERFALSLGHDLRNPLGAILMSATVLSRKVDEEDVKRAIGRILTAGTRMNHMITALVDFTRARTPTGLRLECARTDLATVFRQAIADASESAKGRSVTLEHQGDVRGSWDPSRLAQVAAHLVDNAVRHGTPGGTVDVRIDGRDESRVTVDVRSVGTIAADLLPVVFEPFQDGELQNRRGGLGLGLFITREIVAAHRGSVGVISAGDATTFTLSLPRGS